MDLALRPATPEDREFLFSLFVSSRDLDFSFFAEPQRSDLLRLQFRGQQQTYTQRYPAGTHEIVLVDGRPAGRLWIAETAEEIRIVDIALLPVYRNLGIGKRLYAGLTERADALGVPLRATVSTLNPGSLRFHESLKFERSGGDAMYIDLVRPGQS